MVNIMNAVTGQTRDELEEIRGELLSLSSQLRRFRRKMRKHPEMTSEMSEALRDEQQEIDLAMRDINLYLFDDIMRDIDQPKEKLLMSIQKVNAKIKAVEQVNEGIGKVVQILKPLTTLLTMITSPGSALSGVGMAGLFAEIGAIA
jgi:hypothetical protein